MVTLTTFSPPDNIRHQEVETSAHVEEKDLGTGTLYIAESEVSWVSNDGQGFSLQYPSISLHAISRDLTAFPKECLYLMLDKSNISDAVHTNAGDESGDEDGNITEVRFVPQNSCSLHIMFEAMSECQGLHPDPDEILSEDENCDENEEDEEDGDEDVVEGSGGFSAEEVIEHLTPSGQATLNRLEAMLNTPMSGETQVDTTTTTDAVNAEPMETNQFEDAAEK